MLTVCMDEETKSLKMELLKEILSGELVTPSLAVVLCDGPGSEGLRTFLTGLFRAAFLRLCAFVGSIYPTGLHV